MPETFFLLLDMWSTLNPNLNINIHGRKSDELFKSVNKLVVSFWGTNISSRIKVIMVL